MILDDEARARYRALFRTSRDDLAQHAIFVAAGELAVPGATQTELERLFEDAAAAQERLAMAFA